MTIRSSSLFLFLSLAAAWAHAAATKPAFLAGSLPPRTQVALPGGAELKWVFALEGAEPWAKAVFDLDLRGAPWVADGRLLRNPLTGTRLDMNASVRGFVWLAAGLVTCDSDSIRLGADAKTRLPYPDMALHPGEGSSFYLSGRDPRSGKYEVFLATLRDGSFKVVKILTAPEPVKAVAGNGRETFVALGKTILSLDPATRKASVVVHSKEPVVDLAYSSDAGLFYAAPRVIGFVGDRPYEIISGVDARIRSRGDALYLLTKEGTLARVSGTAAFRRLKKPGVAAAGLKQEVLFPAGVDLTLPRGVTVRWVVPPLRSSRPATVTDFDVDEAGRPWFGLEHRLVASPVTGALLTAEAPFRDLAWLADGRFVVSNGEALGILEKKKFKALLPLPSPGFRMFPDAGDGVYLTRVAGGKSEVYWMRWGAAGGGKFSARMIAAAEDPVLAVTGDGEVTFIAAGRTVFRVDTKKSEPYFVHPTEVVGGLAFSPKAGLFYATASSVGRARKGNLLEFLKAEGARIRIRGEELFIFLEGSRSVMKIGGEFP